MTITIREAAVDSVEAAKLMRRKGANRIELNAHLEVGGLTPDTRTIIDTLIAIDDVPVVVMIRPRPGDYAYSDAELQQMQDSIHQIADVGGQYVTFGVVRDQQLDQFGDIDRQFRFPPRLQSRLDIRCAALFGRSHVTRRYGTVKQNLLGTYSKCRLGQDSSRTIINDR